MKHLLKLEDWSPEQITRTLNLADQLKYELKHRKVYPPQRTARRGKSNRF